MLQGKTFDQRQPQTGTFIVARQCSIKLQKGLEQPGLVLDCNSQTRVLHGELTGMDVAAGLHFGLGAACLKHSLPGDFLTLPASDVAAFVAEGRLDVRR